MQHQRFRAIIVVEWDLDPVPGWNDNPEDLPQSTLNILNVNKHYNVNAYVLASQEIDPK